MKLGGECLKAFVVGTGYQNRGFQGTEIIVKKNRTKFFRGTIRRLRSEGGGCARTICDGARE